MKCVRPGFKDEIFTLFVFSAIYLLMANARTSNINPFMPELKLGTIIAVPIVAGILFGCRTGLLVGIVAPALNVLTPASSGYDLLLIVPYAFVGFMSGLLQDRIPSPLIAGLALAGNLIKFILFTFLGMLSFAVFVNKMFWFGFIYEGFLEIVIIIVASSIYRLGFDRRAS